VIRMDMFFCRASWSLINISSDAETAEAYACLQSLNLATRCYVVPIVVESDCMNLINEFASSSISRSQISSIVQEA
jgi:hypothetical protein